jgi:TP901 family phage tail tape measure protein
MATRNADLRVTIDANAVKLERELQRTARSMTTLEREINKGNRTAAMMEQQLNQRTAAALRNVGRGMVVFGAAVAAGLGLAAKAAIDWESAWTGVLKTVEGTPEQLAKVEKGLRDLATTLPSSHREIAAVAEAAGQLGIATDDVVAFTRVMVDLGETTNLTAEEAATSIAQMMNVMQTAPEDVGRLGAALVELGNNGASTERDILEMAQRISGAGAIIDLSEADVLAFANALASVGIEAEAGGTALSTAMVKMADAVASGGDSVAEFAEVAGMSAEEFTQAFETDPARAVQAFVEGLGRIDAAGGNVFATLDTLGLGTIRTRDAMLRLAGSGDLLGQSLDDGARAWAENTALIEEAEKRYDTAEAKIAIARNTLVDLAIDVGNVLLPAIAGLAESAADLVKWFSDLPGPVKTVATILAGLVGTVSLLGGGFLLMAPKIAAARVELQLLSTTMPGLATAMRGFTLAIPVIGVLLAAAAGIAAIAGASKEAAPPVSDATKALLDLSGGLSNELIRGTVDAAAAMQRFGELAKDSITPEGVIAATDELNRVTGEFERNIGAMDTALAELVAGGNSEQAEDAFNALAAAMKEQGIGVRDLREMMPGYSQALQEAENQQRLTTESVDPLKDALAELATQYGLTGDDAAKAAQEMLDSWSEAASDFFSFADAYDTALTAKEEAEKETAIATAEATEDATDSWEDFVADVTLSVDDYLAELDRQVKAQEDWEANLLTIAGRVPGAMFNELVAMGPAGADAVALMAEMTDEELNTAVGAWTRTTGEGADAIADRLAEAGPVLAQIAADHGQKIANKVRDHMIKNGVGVFDAAKALDVRIDRGLRPGKNRNIPVKMVGKAQLLRNLGDVQGAISALKGKTITVTASGDVRVTGPGYSGRVATGGEIRGPGGPTADRAGLFALSDREWVIRAAAAGKYGPKAMAAINAGLAQILLPGEGGRQVTVKAKGNLDATDFNRLGQNVAVAAYKQSAGSPAFAGKVLPPGSYRIGRGPAGHGYNARDLPAPIGTPVYAAASGIVSQAARLATSYGIHAAISHAGWRSLYAHMSQMYVRTGQQVTRGQMIGRVGSTGNSTGPHLHLEPDNPRLYDRGGKWAHGTFGFNGSGGTEYVLSPQQSRLFDRFVSTMERPRGGDGAALRITGDGPAFEWIAKGVRTGQLRLRANGTPVKVA